MFDLPPEIQHKIYQYDPTFKTRFSGVILELSQNFELLQDTYDAFTNYGSMRKRIKQVVRKWRKAQFRAALYMVCGVRSARSRGQTKTKMLWHLAHHIIPTKYIH